MTIEWVTFPDLTPYPIIISRIEEAGAAIAEGKLSERILTFESEPVYTRGDHASERDLIEPNRLPIYPEERGGSYTYHGPGVRLYCPLLNLKKRHMHLRDYQDKLTAWIIQSLKKLNIVAHAEQDWPGAWVKVEAAKKDRSFFAALRSLPSNLPYKEINARLDAYRSLFKVAATGFYVEKWVTHLGIALNYNADLEDLAGIRACGLPPQYGVTSLKNLGFTLTLEQLDKAFQEAFDKIFNA